jgi:hypothetical protein
MAYTLVTGSTDVTKKIRYLNSFSFTENAGTPAAARVQLKNGSTSGDLLVDVQLAASGTTQRDFPKPLYFPLGVYVQVSAGTVRGSVSGL